MSFIKRFFNSFEKLPTNKIVRVTGFFIAPIFLLVALEVMHFSDITAFPAYFKDFYWPLKLILTYTFLLGGQCIFYTIFRNAVFANLINSLLFYILSFVTYVTLDLTGDPLLPSDLLLVKNIKEIASFVEIPFSISYIISFIIMASGVAFLYILRKKYPFKFKFRYRIMLDIALVLAFAIVVYAFCINYNFRYNALKKINVNISAFNPVEDLQSNGVILTFFPRVGDLIVDEPQDYSEQKIAEIKEKYSSVKSIASSDKRKISPNVIIIQNEAWWDPTELPGVTFSEDPMKEIKELGEKFPFGKLVSPAFSGSTCMPEFECITGYSTAFLPGNSYPYIQHILSDTESVVSTYKKNDYETVALHSYHINFYSRDSAYPLLGFDKVLGMDDMPGIYENHKGWYPSDDFTADQIIKAYEEKESDRLFCFTVTMQNHGGYNPKRYKPEEYTLSASSDALSEADLQGVLDFSQGVKDSSDSYMKLVNYFEKKDEPVLLVMYGDHLPLLGTEGSTYIDSGMVENEGSFVPTKHHQLYYTPYIVWANYDISDFEFPKFISPANLGLTVLKYSYLDEVPWYQSVFKEFYNLMPVYEKYIKYTADLQRVENENNLSDEIKHFVNDYKMLQYDLIHFNRYSKNPA